MSKFYDIDIGTIIECDMGTDISAGATFEIHVQQPDGTEVIFTGALYGTNYIRYKRLTGELSQLGTYSAQGRVIFTGGVDDYYGDTDTFVISDKYG
jgi:hypothetical protein